jgi:hypothetical protein
MITPSKEESEQECGTRVEVNSNSDIPELFLNTDRRAGRLITGLSENVNTPRASLAASVQTLSTRQSFLYMHLVSSADRADHLCHKYYISVPRTTPRRRYA